MRYGNLFLFLIFLIFLVFVPGCGEPECEVDNDCYKNTCFESSCVKEECVHNPLPNCCGNAVKEDLEDGEPGNKCTCPEDYGKCKGDEGEYFEQRCNEFDECVPDVKEDLFETLRPVIYPDIRGGELKVTSTFNQPYNALKDVFKLEFQMDEFDERYDNIHLKKVELVAKTKGNQEVILASKIIDKTLWDPQYIIREDIIFDFPDEKEEDELRSLELKIIYTYDKIEDGIRETKEEIKEKKYSGLKFKYIFPQNIELSCPPIYMWSDDNEATDDNCGEDTNYFVIHEPIPNTCGNLKCEGSENKCICSSDCGNCNLPVGDYLEYYCNPSFDCVTKIASNVEVIEKTLLDEKNVKKASLTIKTKFNRPFDISKDTYNFEFTLESFDLDANSTGYLKIKKVILLEGDNIMGENGAAQTLSNPGMKISYGVDLSIYNFEGYEHSVSPKLKVWYEYSVSEGDDTDVDSNDFIISTEKNFFIKTDKK